MPEETRLERRTATAVRRRLENPVVSIPLAVRATNPRARPLPRHPEVPRSPRLTRSRPQLGLRPDPAGTPCYKSSNDQGVGLQSSESGGVSPLQRSS
ncbi:hypothetical protein RHMOL_Rhmol03G0118300 [Rhododendron molle]|uniref:Uncharacterized protein n=1 Tax=Rhododendron molle TaxID=49168 RepID=A0ACC0PFU7_RHOML|nr:hypothetical protein RHMOL_Rhmol03G0118300 [Rhododendron molle]